MRIHQLLGFALVNPLVPRIAGRIKRTVREIRGEPSPSGSAASPYEQWHGPAPGTTFDLVATAVADIVVIQGCAPEGTAVSLEFDNDVPNRDVPHRFPHPMGRDGRRTCFETTIDATNAVGATRCRLIAEDLRTNWRDLPTRQAHGAMEATDILDRCPACRSAEFVHAGRRQHLSMETCVRCGLVMTTPRPAEDLTLMRYSERYFEEEYLPSQQMSDGLAAHIDSILDLVEPARGVKSTLFELGVGGGNLAARAAARGWTVSGTDVNVASVAHAADRGLNVWHENVDHADSLGGSYGAVVSEMSLEHVRHPERFCELASDALVADGRLVIYTVSAEGASFEHSSMASPLVGPAEHLFLFSAGALVSLCQRAGLRVDSVWRNPSSDEIGVVAVKRRDVGNPGVAASASG